MDASFFPSYLPALPPSGLPLQSPYDHSAAHVLSGLSRPPPPMQAMYDHQQELGGGNGAQHAGEQSGDEDEGEQDADDSDDEFRPDDPYRTDRALSGSARRAQPGQQQQQQQLQQQYNGNGHSNGHHYALEQPHANGSNALAESSSGRGRRTRTAPTRYAEASGDEDDGAQEEGDDGEASLGEGGFGPAGGAVDEGGAYPPEDAEDATAGAGGDEHEPLYVNAKQYHRILKRRSARARLEEMGRLSRQRKVRLSPTVLGVVHALILPLFTPFIL
ncbi:hypothetical protein RQP46_007365 [Phenoliferia psychrophenolica]